MFPASAIAAGSEPLVVATADQPVADAAIVVMPAVAPGPADEPEEMLAADDGERGGHGGQVAGWPAARNSQRATLEMATRLGKLDSRPAWHGEVICFASFGHSGHQKGQIFAFLRKK